jgi:hypothetical protein
MYSPLAFTLAVSVWIVMSSRVEGASVFMLLGYEVRDCEVFLFEDVLVSVFRCQNQNVKRFPFAGSVVDEGCVSVFVYSCIFEIVIVHLSIYITNGKVRVWFIKVVWEDVHVHPSGHQSHRVPNEVHHLILGECSFHIHF